LREQLQVRHQPKQRHFGGNILLRWSYFFKSFEVRSFFGNPFRHHRCIKRMNEYLENTTVNSVKSQDQQITVATNATRKRFFFSFTTHTNSIRSRLIPYYFPYLNKRPINKMTDKQFQFDVVSNQFSIIFKVPVYGPIERRAHWWMNDDDYLSSL
jgi:hypothetical protein